MITLTTPRTVLSVLGNTTTVSYDKMVLAPFTMDVVNQRVTGTVRLTSTSTPAMQPILGTFVINVPTSEFTMEVPQLDFYRRIVLSGAQNTAILNQIETALAALENGLVTLGVVAGTRSAGS